MEAKLLRASASSPAIPALTGFKFTRPSCVFALKTRQSSAFAVLSSSLPEKRVLTVNASSTLIGSSARRRIHMTPMLSPWMDKIALWWNTCSKKPKSFMPGWADTKARMNILSFPLNSLIQCCHLCNTPRYCIPSADFINVNGKVWDMYFRDLIPRLVEEGDDGNCGSTAVCDTMCLQTLSKRIHYGKFVAEAKFRADPEAYEAAIRAQDKDKLMSMLTYPTVEEAIKRRVEMKARAYGQEVTVDDKGGADPVYKINPGLVANLYGDWIMPLTKEVQVQYLLRRLD
ncbi:Chorismate mutase [Melia azedarach]|uniref:Chorismate mutase n=1 Tax=Melia azedarach TaxID=155640 RepID=A0ACC1X8S9_MELAZ|nr:Chorismate mutase [Melia azedarach]